MKNPGFNKSFLAIWFLLTFKIAAFAGIQVPAVSIITDRSIGSLVEHSSSASSNCEMTWFN